jgi:hypothetical protein
MLSLPSTHQYPQPVLRHTFLTKKSSLHLRGRSRGGSTAATAEATTELGVELARGGTLLALASVTATVLAALAVATGTTTAAAGTLLAAEHAAGGSVGALLLDVGLGDDLGGEVEPLAEVVEALGGEAVEEGVRRGSKEVEGRLRKGLRVVVPLPGELGLEETARGQGLASLDDKEVLGVNVAVLGLVEVLLCDENTL